MCRRQQFLRISADTIFKARTEGILRLIQDAALRRERTFSIFEIALPNRTCFSLHDNRSFRAAVGRFEFVFVHPRRFCSRLRICFRIIDKMPPYLPFGQVW